MKNLARCLLAFGLVASTLLVAPSEAAAGPLDLDRDSFFIVTAERMFGFSYSTQKTEVTVGNTTATATDQTTGISLLAPTGSNPYTIPMVGLHYSVIPALTLGAGLGFARTSGSIKSETTGKPEVEIDKDPRTAFIVAPRVGYILGFSNAFYLWARGGITYFHASSSSTDSSSTIPSKIEESTSGLAISLDPMFVVTPVNHFGFMFGPVADIGVSGSRKIDETTGSTTKSSEQDVKITNFGLQIGLLGYL